MISVCSHPFDDTDLSGCAVESSAGLRRTNKHSLDVDQTLIYNCLRQKKKKKKLSSQFDDIAYVQYIDAKVHTG